MKKTEKKQPASTLKGTAAADSDSWLRHLIKSSEVIDGVPNPSAFYEGLAYVQVNDIKCWGISGRLLSVAKGSIRKDAEARCKGKTALKFHGVLVNVVEAIRQGEADVYQTTKNPSHATLFFTNLDMVGDLPSMEFVSEFVDQYLPFVAENDPKFQKLDEAPKREQATPEAPGAAQ